MGLERPEALAELGRLPGPLEDRGHLVPVGPGQPPVGAEHVERGGEDVGGESLGGEDGSAPPRQASLPGGGVEDVAPVLRRPAGAERALAQLQLQRAPLPVVGRGQ